MNKSRKGWKRIFTMKSYNCYGKLCQRNVKLLFSSPFSNVINSKQSNYNPVVFLWENKRKRCHIGNCLLHLQQLYGQLLILKILLLVEIIMSLNARQYECTCWFILQKITKRNGLLQRGMSFSSRLAILVYTTALSICNTFGCIHRRSTLVRTIKVEYQ